MRKLIENFKTKLICRRTRTKMLSSYLSSDYFGFNENTHASSCIKCQVSGKRYKAFKDEFEKKSIKR